MLHVEDKAPDVITGDLETNVLSLCSSSGDEDVEGEEGEQPPMKLHPSQAKAERSHLIVWQILDNED